MTDPRLKNAVLLSIVAAILTLALKCASYFLTGSVGILSDAAEAGVNMFAALMAYFSLWYSAQPVDPEHTYGHEKIEFFASGLEGVLILTAAAGISGYAIFRLLGHEIYLEQLGIGTVVVAAATLINLAVGLYLLRIGRARESIVLEADGKHLMTDVWASVGVITGLTLVTVTGFQALDAAVALLVAASFVWTGYDLVRRSFHGLMDHALPVVEQEVVRAVIAGRLEPGMDFHALRTRKAGSQRFADFHLLVPGDLTVKRAHAITAKIEEAVRSALPGIEVTVHIEPIEEKAAWEDSALLLLEQAARQAGLEKSGGEPSN
jgi:cation diffusion facilitator family transporter